MGVACIKVRFLDGHLATPTFDLRTCVNAEGEMWKGKGMEETVIRLARDDDLEIIKQIAVEAWKPIYECFQKTAGNELFATVFGDWRTTKEEQIAGHYKSHPETILVTEHKGQVVGFITYNIFEKQKAGVIGNNAVHPKYQGRGFGTKQYQRVLAIFKERGMKFAQVHTGADEAHVAARTAYEKVGFKPVFYSVLYCQKL